MSVPVPAPRRFNNEKKPVPAPRELIPIRPSRIRDNKNEETEKIEVSFTDVKNDINSNTFTKRVKTLGNASKQIAEDIGGKVQEGKKAVMESTRLSVRRLTRRFHSVSSDLGDDPKEEDSKNDIDDIPANIFNSIKFNSPINTEPTYLNVGTEENIVNEDEDYNRPPPPYPPPPLREESLYDEPQSVVSGSSNSNSSGSGNTKSLCVYESVFPSYPYNSDSESCVDLTGVVIENNIPLNRSESWKFYDQVPKVEQIYSNVDNTPILNPNNNEIKFTRAESCSSHITDNTLYDNEIEIRNSPPINKRPTESVIMQFDPLRTADLTPDVNLNIHSKELDSLQQLLLGDLYSNTNFSTIDNWSISNDSETEDYISPPPPPPQRIDSLPEEQSPVLHRKESRTSWYTNTTDNNNVTPKSSSIGMNLFKQVNGVLKKAPHLVKVGKSKETSLSRPALFSKGTNHHKGLLYKVTNGPVEDLFGEFNSRWCTLEGQLFLCHFDNSCNNIKENFPLESILSIQILQDPKYKYKFLGVCIDSELRWRPHIEVLAKKLSSGVFAVKRIKATATHQAARVTYFSLFHSHLSYGLVFWCMCAGAERIFLLQKRALRILCSLKYNESCRGYFKREGILTLVSVYIHQVLKYVHTNKSSFQTNGLEHSYTTRQRGDLRLPYHRLAITQRDVNYWGVKLYNKLPIETKNLNHLAFARKTKKLLLDLECYTIDDFLSVSLA